MTAVDRAFDVRRYISPYAGFLAGSANVIMQLSWPAVGYGVKESRVESGSAMKHPLKRARTTFTYLAVALFGDEADRAAFRNAVDGQHRQVRSTADSPVRYNAMDPQLQLWVAACLYYGLVDVTERMQGPIDEETADQLYRFSARLGTSLQVREDMWPADREAFRRYWEESLSQVHIDPTIREYLMSLVRLDNLPDALRLLFSKDSLFWTTGFLPPEFRSQMGLDWTETDQKRFDRRLRRIGRLERLVPLPLRVLPFTILLADMRLRLRTGRPLV